MSKYQNPKLNERESTHGDYRNTANCAQHIKAAIHNCYKDAHPGGGIDEPLEIMAIESLDLIATKLARLASGSLTELDTWEDIAGYANLITERLSGPLRD